MWFEALESWDPLILKLIPRSAFFLIMAFICHLPNFQFICHLPNFQFICHLLTFLWMLVCGMQLSCALVGSQIWTIFSSHSNECWSAATISVVLPSFRLVPALLLTCWKVTSTLRWELLHSYPSGLHLPLLPGGEEYERGNEELRQRHWVRWGHPHLGHCPKRAALLWCWGMYNTA